MAFIELARATVFADDLACSASGGLQLAGDSVVHKDGVTTVFKNGQPVIATDGKVFLAIDGVRFEAERKLLRLRGLRSNGSALSFDWTLEGDGDYRCVGVHDSGDAGTSFIVKHHQRLGFNPNTKVRVETAPAQADTTLMLGCLVFFWTYFENDRVSYA